jgi:hypothetical protein
MYHYTVYAHTGGIVLDSSRREDFDGYSTGEAARKAGKNSMQDNRLDPDKHTLCVSQQSHITISQTALQ